MNSSELDLDGSFHSLIDQDEVNYKVAEQLNNIFGQDIKNLHKAPALVEQLTKTRNDLEKRLRFATTEAPDKISHAVQAADEALRHEEELQAECKQIHNQLQKHCKKIQPLLDEVGPGVRQVRELERVQAYQRWVARIKELSNSIQCALTSNDEQEATLRYSEVRELTEQIDESQCTHLQEYTRRTLLHCHRMLTARFTREFEAILKLIKWPFMGDQGGVKEIPPSAENIQQLEVLMKLLLHVRLPITVQKMAADDQAVAARDTGKPMPGIVADYPSLLPPLQLLLRPFEVRFCYHFSGNKATNCREKPEWYLTQVLRWITTHDAFLDSRIQPVLNSNGYRYISAKVELMRGLVRLVVLKLASDLPEMDYNEDLFCRTLQETLNFERELRIGFGYPSNQPSVLAVLTQAHIFAQWIRVERKFALELMDDLVSGGDAWEFVDTGEAAHCGEQLIMLLQGITDRYKPLPQPGHRLQFLELQLELIEDFRVRVVQLMKSELADPLTSNYGSILNTVHHITATLTDWDYIPFFVEMQYYREQFSRLQDQHAATVTGGTRLNASPIAKQTSSRRGLNITKSTYLNTSISSTDDVNGFSSSLDTSTLLATSALSPEHLARQDALDSLNCDGVIPSSIALTEVCGSVFEDAVKLYCHIEGEMIEMMSSHAVSEVRARSQGYRRDKWFATNADEDENYHHNQSSSKVTEVNPSLCPMLEVLARHLLALRVTLATPLFTKLWHNIAASLNKFIYEEVILQNYFSESGAAQLEFDMIKALFPIFGEFTSKPENYFKLVKESIVLLTLPRATALLLKDTLKLWRQDRETFSLAVSPVKALAEHGVSLLSPDEADVILNIRTNMANN